MSSEVSLTHQCAVAARTASVILSRVCQVGYFQWFTWKVSLTLEYNVISNTNYSSGHCNTGKMNSYSNWQPSVNRIIKGSAESFPVQVIKKRLASCRDLTPASS